MSQYKFKSIKDINGNKKVYSVNPCEVMAYITDSGKYYIISPDLNYDWDLIELSEENFNKVKETLEQSEKFKAFAKDQEYSINYVSDMFLRYYYRELKNNEGASYRRIRDEMGDLYNPSSEPIGTLIDD